MHSFLKLHFSHILSHVEGLMEDMALDTRAYRGLSYDFRDRFESSASSPSLRASELSTPGYLADGSSGGDSNDAGNVKVVVRVRQFVQRGAYPVSIQVFIYWSSANLQSIQSSIRMLNA